MYRLAKSGISADSDWKSPVVAEKEPRLMLEPPQVICYRMKLESMYLYWLNPDHIVSISVKVSQDNRAMSKIPVIAFPEEGALAPIRRPTHPVVRYVKILSRTTLLATLIIFFVAKYVIGPALSTTLKRRFELQNSAYTRLKALHNKLRHSVKEPPSIHVSYNGKILVDRTISSDDIIIEEAKQYDLEQFKKNSKGSFYSSKFSYEGNTKEVRFSEDTSSSSDRSTFSELNHKMDSGSSRLSKSLQSLKEKLNDLKVPEYTQLSNSGYSRGDPDMNSLLYQIKQFKTYLEVVTSEHPREMLFKKPLYHIKVGRDDDRIVKFNYLDILNDNIDNMKHIVDSRGDQAAGY